MRVEPPIEADAFTESLQQFGGLFLKTAFPHKPALFASGSDGARLRVPEERD
jgi:hypothetical protein